MFPYPVLAAGGWARPAVTPRAREEIFRQFWFDSIYVLETQNIPILIWRISYFSLFCATGVRTTVDVRDTTRSKKTFVNGIFSKSKKCSEGWQQRCSQPFDGNYELKVPSFTLSGYIVYY